MYPSLSFVYRIKKGGVNTDFHRLKEMLSLRHDSRSSSSAEVYPRQTQLLQEFSLIKGACPWHAPRMPRSTEGIMVGYALGMGQMI